ncbi:hypothetical protein VTK26DRAFT_2989 [Humicola hyalothermophila]
MYIRACSTGTRHTSVPSHDTPPFGMHSERHSCSQRLRLPEHPERTGFTESKQPFAPLLFETASNWTPHFAWYPCLKKLWPLGAFVTTGSRCICMPLLCQS